VFKFVWRERVIHELGGRGAGGGGSERDFYLFIYLFIIFIIMEGAGGMNSNIQFLKFFF
jgi:hypothetical protein